MDVTEPVYHYIPGKGWIADISERYLAYDKNGLAVWLVNRPPEYGEMYVNTYYHSDWVIDGKVQFETIAKAHTNKFSYAPGDGSRWRGFSDVHLSSHLILTIERAA